jgi:hemerythrin
MEFLTWTDRYSVGVKEIDDQHKQLIGMINDLHAAMLSMQGKEALTNVLHKLANYCVSHFSLEEKLMSDNGYPGYAEHKDKHVKMTIKVQELVGAVKSGKSTITIDVMNFLKNWLDMHIMGTDKQYGPFLNSKGVK